MFTKLSSSISWTWGCSWCCRGIYLVARVLLNVWVVLERTIFRTSCILILPGIFCVYLSIISLTKPTGIITTSIVGVFMLYILLIYISRFLYSEGFSLVFKEVFFPRWEQTCQQADKRSHNFDLKSRPWVNQSKNNLSSSGFCCSSKPWSENKKKQKFE